MLMRPGKPSAQRFGLVCSAVLVGVLVCFPILWAITTSLKVESRAISFPPTLLPDPVTFANYLRVITNKSFALELFNSVLYSVASVVISLAVGLPAGYAAARFDFRGKHLLMIVIMATAMVPSIALIVPIYLFLDRMELLNNNLVIMIVSAARLAPQTVWFCRNFVSSVPVEIEEAALMDGASRMQILMRLVIPLIKPGLAAIIVLGLIHTWNDYVIVAVFAPAATTRTLQVALVNQVFDGIGISWSYFMAYAIVASVPVVAIFLVAQKWFVAGLTAGATKG